MEILRSTWGENVCLGETTSNLFRDCKSTSAKKLDVRDFNVLHIDVANGDVVVEGMTPYSGKNTVQTVRSRTSTANVCSWNENPLQTNSDVRFDCSLRVFAKNTHLLHPRIG